MNEEPKGGERIAKVLSRAGVASRREAERMIASGRVSVNGRVIDSPALNVMGSDRIAVDGRAVAAAEAPRLWLYHKPPGLVTSARDEKGRATVFDALPADMPRVMPVGRLDLNSEGLLLLTNDGGLKRRLELPATGWLRRYRVRVHGVPDEARLEGLRRGMEVAGERFQGMSVVIDRQQGANAWLTVGLREGRNREIRRAMEAVGLEVNRLIRVGYGPFKLGAIKAGAVEEVRARVLRDQLGLDGGGAEAVGAAAADSAGGASGKRGVRARAATTVGTGSGPGADTGDGSRPAQGLGKVRQRTKGSAGKPSRADGGGAAGGRAARPDAGGGNPPVGETQGGNRRNGEKPRPGAPRVGKPPRHRI